MSSTKASDRAAFAADGSYKAADAERDRMNEFKPGSADHAAYAQGWDHGAHRTPRIGKRTPANTRGVVHGLMWRRINPRSPLDEA